jgi:hypothetical protein
MAVTGTTGLDSVWKARAATEARSERASKLRLRPKTDFILFSAAEVICPRTICVFISDWRSTRVDRVRIRWPNGNTEESGPVEADRVITIKESKAAQ